MTAIGSTDKCQVADGAFDKQQKPPFLALLPLPVISGLKHTHLEGKEVGRGVCVCVCVCVCKC